MTARTVIEPAAPGTLEPEAPGADAFVDALLGLDRLCHRLAGTLDGAAVDGEGAALRGRARGGAPGDDFDDVLDAVLGAMSMRTTLSLVLGALVGEAADAIAEPAGDASTAWSREQLR